MNHFVTWGSIAFYFIFSLFYGGIIWYCSTLFLYDTQIINKITVDFFDVAGYDHVSCCSGINMTLITAVVILRRCKHCAKTLLTAGSGAVLGHSEHLQQDCDLVNPLGL